MNFGSMLNYAWNLNSGTETISSKMYSLSTLKIGDGILKIISA